MKLDDYLHGVRQAGFEPRPYYCPDSDSITYFAVDADHYAQRVDSLLTVFLHQESNELVGFKIKGVVARLKDRLKKFEAIVEDSQEFPVGNFVLAGLTLSTDGQNVRCFYERCADVSTGARVPRNELTAAGTAEAAGRH